MENNFFGMEENIQREVRGIPPEYISDDVLRMTPERMEEILQNLRVQGERRTYLERVARERSLKKVVNEYGVAFVHSMTPYLARRGSGNSILQQNVTLRDQIEIVLTIQPPLSTSTIKEGDSAMWGEVGVFLSGGRIAKARGRDDGTVAMSPQRRKSSQGRGGVDIAEGLSEDSNLRQEIRRAIQKQDSGINKPYNELVVYSPEISGVYVNIDRNIPGSENYQSPEQVFEVLQEFKMPLYITDSSGRFYRGQIRAGVFEKGDEISYKDILQSSCSISLEDRERNLERWIDDPPFNLDFYLPEKKIYNHVQEGMQMFREGNCNEECLQGIDASNTSLSFATNEKDMQYLVGPLWLHGYAIEAKRSGKADLGRIAEGLAVKYISKEMLESFLSDRIDSNGHFIVKKDDFLQ